MAKIYKTTDRVEFKIGDMTVKIAPLSMSQKNEVQALLLEGSKKTDAKILGQSMLLALKYCLKDLQGVTDSDDNPYQLKFDSGILTDETVEELMNMEYHAELLQVCGAFVKGVPTKLDIAGVEIIEKKSQATV